MLARLQTFSLPGIDAVPVDMEVDVSTGALPSTVLVSLPNPAISESTHRMVLTALSCQTHSNKSPAGADPLRKPNPER